MRNPTHAIAGKHRGALSAERTARSAFRLPFRRRLLLLRAECDKPRFIGFEKGSADQVDTVGDRGENCVQALVNRLGLTGQVDD